MLKLSDTGRSKDLEEDDKDEDEDDFEDAEENLRVIWITGPIDSDAFEKFDKRLSVLESRSSEPIVIRICSPGGDVNEGMAICGRIRSSSCQIVTEGYGEIASMATMVLASGHKRKVSSLSYFMYHECTTGAIGKLHDVVSEVKSLVWKEKIFAEMMAKLTKQPAKYWMKLSTSGKDCWFSAQDVVEKLGCADEVI